MWILQLCLAKAVLSLFFRSSFRWPTNKWASFSVCGLFRTYPDILSCESPSSAFEWHFLSDELSHGYPERTRACHKSMGAQKPPWKKRPSNMDKGMSTQAMLLSLVSLTFADHYRSFPTLPEQRYLPPQPLLISAFPTKFSITYLP